MLAEVKAGDVIMREDRSASSTYHVGVASTDGATRGASEKTIVGRKAAEDYARSIKRALARMWLNRDDAGGYVEFT